MSLRLFIILFTNHFYCIGICQDYNPIFETINVNTGLSQNSIQSIIQDDKGYMWFGSQDGLNRFDGHEFTVFVHDPEDSTSIDNNFISDIAKDNLGNLWVGTYTGINYYDRLTELFERFDFNLTNLKVYDIEIDEKNRLWVATNKGLFKLDRSQSNRLEKVNLSFELSAPENYRSLFIDIRGWIWMGDPYNGLLVYDPKSGEVVKMDIMSSHHKDISALYYDKSNDLVYVGCNNKIVSVEIEASYNNNLQLDKKNFTKKEFAIESHRKNSLKILKILKDKDNQVWLATNSEGILILDSNDSSLRPYKHRNLDNGEIINNNWVQTIYEDYSGNLWFGFQENGILKMHKSKTVFEVYRETPNKHNSLNSSKIRGVLEDSKGILWIATADGLNRFDRSKNQFEQYTYNPSNPSSISDDDVKIVTQDNAGFLWVGTNNGLNKLDPITKKSQRFLSEDNALSNNKIRAIHIESTEIVWVGTLGGGLNLLSDNKYTVYKNDPNNEESLGNDNVMSIYDYQNDELLIGTYGGGVYRFDKKTGSFKKFPLNKDNTIKHISFISDDGGDNILIGTYGDGMFRINKITQKITQFTERDGLADNVVYAILASEGFLWISTNHGLSKLNPITSSFTNYEVADGLQSNEFNTNSFFKNEKGELFFGGVNGLNIFHPNDIQDNSILPKPEITKLIIFNQTVRINEVIKDEVPLTKSIGYTDTLQLSYEHNVFGFEFSALHYANSSKNNFTYMLEGFDTDWMHTDAKTRTASYTNLNPGNYTFKLRGSNNDNFWNENVRTLFIVISPPFWKLWWFTPLIIIFGVGLVAYQIRGKINKEKTVRRLLNKQVSERTIELKEKNEELKVSRNYLANINQSKDSIFFLLSHDLRGPLTRIQGFMNLLRKKGAISQDDIDFHTKKIENDIRDSITLLDNTLYWSMLSTEGVETKNEKLELEDVLEKVISRFNRKIHEKDLSLKIDLSTSQVYADAVLIRIALQNLISNAIKFSHKSSSILITTIKNDNTTVISIEDFGIGIDQCNLAELFNKDYSPTIQGTHNEKGTGLGLVVCDQIVKIHGGSINVESEINKGSKFSISLPDSH